MNALRGGSAIGAAVIACVAASVASAQAVPPKDIEWTLEGGMGGYCIWYLADPALARKLVPSSTSLVPAGTGGELPALLASTIREEPKFAQWIPGSICLGFYQRIVSAGRTIAEGKPGKPVIIATSSIAAQAAHGVPGANHYLIDLMTNDRGVSNAADGIGVDMSSIQMVRRSPLEGEDPNVILTLDGIQITWAGHAIADSSVGRTRGVSFGYGGPKSINWLINMESSPQSSRLMVGVLLVGGGNNLAKVLKASPVRAIGPESRGGTATMTFHTVTKK